MSGGLQDEAATIQLQLEPTTFRAGEIQEAAYLSSSWTKLHNDVHILLISTVLTRNEE